MIRPQPLILLTYGLVLLGLVIVGVGLTVDALWHGQLGPALFFIPVTGFFAFGLIYIVAPTLWADSDRVGKTQLFFGGSCRRDELAQIEIGEPYSRMGPSYRFIRKDGGVAFTGTAVIWKKPKVAALAEVLGVPFIPEKHAADTRGYVCPVCGYPGLEEPAARDGVGSHEICPSCGFEFVGAIDEQRYADWRAQWMQGGMTWYGANAGVPAPDAWDPTQQLKALTG